MTELDVRVVVLTGEVEGMVMTVEKVELGLAEVDDALACPPQGLPLPQAKHPLVQPSSKKAITVLSWFWMLCGTPAALYASSQPLGPYTLLVHPATGVFGTTLAGVSLSPITSVHNFTASP
jgi:hypothetical protein